MHIFRATMKPAYRIEVFRQGDKDWCARVIARNGKELWRQTEGLKRKGPTLRVIANIFGGKWPVAILPLLLVMLCASCLVPDEVTLSGFQGRDFWTGTSTTSSGGERWGGSGATSLDADGHGYGSALALTWNLTSRREAAAAEALNKQVARLVGAVHALGAAKQEAVAPAAPVVDTRDLVLKPEPVVVAPAAVKPEPMILGMTVTQWATILGSLVALLGGGKFVHHQVKKHRAKKANTTKHTSRHEVEQ